jgi:hypothetical protein
MFKRYKRDVTGAIVAYHEVWVDLSPRRIVEHWGMLGEPGETDTHRIKLLGSLERQINGLLGPAEDLGFEEIDDGEYKTLTVEYALSEARQPEDREKIEAVCDALTEILGWTGLGHCDGETVTSQTIELTCRVLDVNLAEEKIADAFKDTEFSGYARIYQE